MKCNLQNNTKWLYVSMTTILSCFNIQSLFITANQNNIVTNLRHRDFLEGVSIGGLFDMEVNWMYDSIQEGQDFTFVVNLI